MESITSIAQPSSASAAAPPRNSFGELGSDDFFKLLIAQLTNQDPLEPTGNQELFEQIASIRDIELSTSLSKSLQSLTGGQRFASGSSMIGQFVIGVPGEGGAAQEGLVVGVRFDGGGNAVLLLADGGELPLEQVATIQPPLDVARALIGKMVTGMDRGGSFVEGLVAAVRMENGVEIVLELDGGDALRFRDLATVASSSV